MKRNTDTVRRGKVADAIRTQSCPDCNKPLSFIRDQDVWDICIMTGDPTTGLQPRYGSWCACKAFLQFDLNGRIVEPGVIQSANEEVTSFGYTLRAFAEMSNEVYRSWIECPTCKQRIDVPREYTSAEEALGEACMNGYMHNRAHSRKEI